MATNFDLDKAIAAWRRPLENERAFLDEDLEELETHLRDYIDRLIEDEGRPEEDAFKEATASMGHYYELKPEYEKIRWLKHKHRRSIWSELRSEAGMLKNYVTLTFRTLRRQKVYAGINIIGLSMGLVCCMLIGLYVFHQSTYDSYHGNADRIYRLIYSQQEGDEAPKPSITEFRSWGSAAPGPQLKEHISDVVDMVRFSGGHTTLLSRDEAQFVEENYFYVDSTVFDVFDFPFVQGNPQTALDAPHSIVLTESTARRYFQDENPMGKTILQDNEIPLTVTGIMADLPDQSHFDIDMLMPMEAFIDSTNIGFIFENWGYIDFFTYVLLPEEHDISNLKAQMPAFIDRYRNGYNEDNPTTLFLDFEPLQDVYLSKTRQDPVAIGPLGNATSLRLFTLIGLFILLIACINFTNLSTARSAERAREVGIRKALGSQRKTLVRQFLLESIVLSFISLVGAALLLIPGIQVFNHLSGIQFPVSLLLHPWSIVILLGLCLLMGVLAGSYPAFVLSAFKPTRVLKGAFKHSRQGIYLRRGLVISQFTLSIILLVGTFIVFQQVRYMQNQTLGFDKEQQLVIDYGYDRTVIDQMTSMKATWLEHPSVQSVAVTRSLPGGYRPDAYTTIERANGEMESRDINIFQVDIGLIEHLGLEMAAGRPYSADFSSDSSAALVVNEAAARLFGYQNAADMVGRRFYQWGHEGVIIGVVKDFHHESLHKPIEPLTFSFEPTSTTYFVLNISTENVNRTLADLSGIWSERVPHRPFEYHFLDEEFDATYHSERRFGALFGWFTGLALFIACLGLIGTATYSAQQRRKEVGVRKVLGASISQVVLLLSKEIVTLVGVAFLVALPIAYFGMQQWLELFAHRTSMNLLVFLLAGLIVLCIALMSVSHQTLRAATMNPTTSLRSE